MRRAAASLVEVLVCVAVVAALAGLLLAGVQKVRAIAARVQCGNNLRQIGLAATAYHDLEGHLPPSVSRAPGARYPSLGWIGRLLPYLDQAAAWDRACADYTRSPRPLDQAAPHANVSLVLSVLGCPADPRTATAWRVPQYGWKIPISVTSYLGNAGTRHRLQDGVILADSRLRLLHITDGASNTVLAFERPPSPDLNYGWWYAAGGSDGLGSLDFTITVRQVGGIPRHAPYRSCPRGPYHFEARSLTDPCGVMHPWSVHPGGANVAICDGSVRFLAYSGDPALPALATRSGGEVAVLLD